MQISAETLRFIREHARDDVRTLALQAKKYPQVDMAVAVTQIAGRQTAEAKLPTWAGVADVRYPKHLSMEILQVVLVSTAPSFPGGFVAPSM